MDHMVQKRNNIELRIIGVLLKGKSHVREIARALKAPHATVFRALKYLSRENAVDFSIEGKNKSYFIKKNLQAKNLVYASELNKLNGLIRQYPEFSIILEDVKKAAPKDMILLFGSYAKGTADKNSDIDLFIESKEQKIRHSLKQLYSRINAKIGPFDTSSLLIKEIIKNHIVIRGIEEFYEKSGFFE